MPKKSVRKKVVHHRKSSGDRVEDKILDNLIELQKVHTNLAEKFDNLTDQISHLLALFESAARSFAKNPHLQVAEKDREFLDKIDKLLEQNKTIAKGLTLMEKKVRDKIYGPIGSPGMGQPPQQRNMGNMMPSRMGG